MVEDELVWNLITNHDDPDQLPEPGQVVLALRRSGVMSVDRYNPNRPIYKFEPICGGVAIDPGIIVAWANVKIGPQLYQHMVDTVGLNASGKIKQASKWLDMLRHQ